MIDKILLFDGRLGMFRRFFVFLNLTGGGRVSSDINRSRSEADLLGWMRWRRAERFKAPYGTTTQTRIAAEKLLHT
jgi:hypothetical protein